MASWKGERLAGEQSCEAPVPIDFLFPNRSIDVSALSYCGRCDKNVSTLRIAIAEPLCRISSKVH